MKKLLIILPFLFSVHFSNSQSICDSITIELTNLGGGEISLNANLNLSQGITAVVESIQWEACDTNLCYYSNDSIGIFNALDISGRLYIRLNITVISNGDTCTYLSLKQYYTYDHGWVYHHTQNPVSSIFNPSLNTISKKERIFDILGREYANELSVPVGLIYIKNGQKYIRNK
jgi:hypothetical protein